MLSPIAHDANRRPGWVEATPLWQRTLFFRPWFEDRSICTPETIATAGYCDLFATTLVTLPPGSHDGDADIVFLDRISPADAKKLGPKATGTLIWTALAEDGWTLERFQTQARRIAGDRQLHLLGQSAVWPYRLTDELQGASGWVAAVSDLPLPSWPKVGFAIPTVDSPECLRDTVLGFSGRYPGAVTFAVVANGSSETSLKHLVETSAMLQSEMTILVEPRNLGYGQGANRGLDHLRETGGFDYFGVVNDDVIPDVDCLCELVAGMQGLESLGMKVGAIGPVSNYVHGGQQVDVGPYEDLDTLHARVQHYHRAHVSEVTQTRQLRGLCLLIHPECLDSVGGFDPRFGIGNFEDDDHNLRCHLAGYSLWIANGAFLYHHGSQTFRSLGVDYSANITRNAEAMSAKWQISDVGDWVHLNAAPRGVALHIPLDTWRAAEHRHPVSINGEWVDLVYQATDLEFAVWISQRLREKPREARHELIQWFEGAA